jgi:hypothetical protein
VYVYWLLLAVFAIGALGEGRSAEAFALANSQWRPYAPAPQSGPRPHGAALVIAALFAILIIGLRYRVGGDWDAYVELFNNARHMSFSGALNSGDPGFWALNWVAGHYVGNEVWVVNLTCAAVFGWGLFRLCSVQPRPWLAFAVAIPYLVIVVAMGYQRQAVALGFLMAGLAR